MEFIPIYLHYWLAFPTIGDTGISISTPKRCVRPSYMDYSHNLKGFRNLNLYECLIIRSFTLKLTEETLW